jgi:hypothetical protein
MNIPDLEAMFRLVIIDMELSRETHTEADSHRGIDHVADAIGRVKRAKGELDAQF